LADYERWSAADELGDRVFAIDGVFSTGAVLTASEAVVRYPTSFMGIDQCALATWTASGVEVARESGSSCEKFMG
jgi:hypothetical protein